MILTTTEDGNTYAVEEGGVIVEDGNVKTEDDSDNAKDDVIKIEDRSFKAEEDGDIKMEYGFDIKAEDDWDVVSYTPMTHTPALSDIPKEAEDLDLISLLPQETPNIAIEDAKSPFLAQLETKPCLDPVSLHLKTLPKPYCSNHGLIVTIQPPLDTQNPFMKHVSCDLVLVIDISASMDTAADMTGGSEDYGFTILNLVQHAALTIIETMNEGDRLGIVTYSDNATVLQPLTVMSDENREVSKQIILNMQYGMMTNMWDGIMKGLDLFKGEGNKGSIPALMVLTDGIPNRGCPRRGYIQQLRTMEPLPAQIHTFGFGYELQSGLLKSIAEFGGGNYAFIPDSTLLGTVFIHAVANLQSTYASKATLKLTYPKSVILEETTGDSVKKADPEIVWDSGEESQQLTIHLGNIQYGQTRDIFLKASVDVAVAPCIQAELSYSRMTGEVFTVLHPRAHDLAPGLLPESEAAYHISRSLVCEFLGSIFPVESDEHHHLRDIKRKQVELRELVKSIPAKDHPDEQNKSLMKELKLEEPEGQIALAIMHVEHYRRWGKHYLLSLQNAHEKQICNSFKDPGPLQYGLKSPLFQRCRKRLDKAFDTIPPPRPHRQVSRDPPKNMEEYNDEKKGCFAARTPVRLASGRTVPIRRLRRGMEVATPAGPRTVVAVLKIPVRRAIVCRINGVLVTPWHPVSLDGKNWSFPGMMEGLSLATYSGPVYSVMLGRDSSPTAHAIRVGNFWGVTLGHGLKTGTDVRAHAFLGDYDLVKKGLLEVGVARGGTVLSGGVARNPTTGLVCGFKRYNGEAAREQPIPSSRERVRTRRTPSLGTTTTRPTKLKIKVSR